MSAKFVLSHLGDQVPDDDIGVFGATRKSYARLVKGKLSDSRLVAVEVDKNSGNLAVPETDATILVSDSEEIGVGLALRYRGDRGVASFVFPAAEEFALLYVPAENLLVGGDNRLACAGAIAFLGLPDNVRRGRGDNAERFGVLVLAAMSCLSAILFLANSSVADRKLTGKT